MPYVLPTLSLSATSLPDHSHSNSLSLLSSPSISHSSSSFPAMSSPSSTTSSTSTSPTHIATPTHSHPVAPSLSEWTSSSAFSHTNRPPIPRSKSKTRFEDPNQEAASPSASSWSPGGDENHSPTSVQAETELPSSQGADSAGRDVDSVCGATTTNEKPFVVEDSSLPSVGAGLNVNSDGVSEGPTGSLARAGREGLKLKIDVQDLVPRSDSFHTGCVVEERVKE